MLLGVVPFALMGIELLAQAFLGIRCSFQHLQGHFEIHSAIRADSDGRDGANPFDDPQATLLRGQIFLWQLLGLLLADRGFSMPPPWPGQL